jgi:hypothetical protein
MCESVLKPPSKIPERNCAPAPKGLQPLATYGGHQIEELHLRFFDGQLLRISVFPSINRLQRMEIVRLISEKYGAPDEEDGETRRWQEPGDRMLQVGPGVIEIANVPLYEVKKARWAAGEAARQQEVAKKVAADQAASSKRKADF